MPVKKQILSNNITLITQPVLNSRVTTFGFYFSVGSRFENEGEHGISHFTEHMLFKGTASKSNREISLVFDRMGGIFNAFTERENVGVYCTVPSESMENYKVALDTLCDLTENCTFPPEEMEKERGVVQSEILAVLDDPDDSAMDEVASCVWPNQKLSLAITGTSDDVNSITREQMLGWYKKYFTEGELVVIVCGRIDEEFLVETLQALSTHRPALEFFRHSHFSEKALWNVEKRILKARFSQTQIFCMYPLSSLLSFEEYISLLIFNSAAGETMSSRLFSSLREQSGLCYSVGSFYTTYENAGLWSAYAVCEKSNAAQVYRRLSDEISGFLENQISDEEIEISKERLCGSEILGETRTAFLMQRLWNFYSMGFPLCGTEKILAGIRSAEKRDIIEFIAKLLNEEKKASLVYGPSLSSRQKKEILCQKK
ncbi:M16 family metallopeptidase [Treponema sp.]|uniref:M16 family metallopeptidase n=1 Tax=Treponema sp. TaxID=166 RepID=UPI003F0AE8F2